MLSVVVHHPLVYRNIMTLVEELKRQPLKNERQLTLQGLCNPATGEIHPSSSLSIGLSSIELDFDIDRHAVHWTLRDGKPLASAAQAHLLEMCDILRKALAQIDRLAQLTHIDWKGPTEQASSHSLIQEALFNVSRQEAETLLLQQPVGTFLFRKDRYTLTLQEILKRALKRSVCCYTLTYLDLKRIVREKTVVFLNHAWTFYDDNPTLSGPFWNSITDLLKSLGPTVKYALPTQRAIQNGGSST